MRIMTGCGDFVKHNPQSTQRSLKHNLKIKRLLDHITLTSHSTKKYNYNYWRNYYHNYIVYFNKYILKIKKTRKSFLSS